MSVNGMSTGQILRRLSGREHIFPAHGAIVLVLILETIVGKEDIDRNAHAALLAMTEGLYTSYTAKTTLIAMKGFLGLRHPKITNIAVVFTELDSTTCALITVLQNNERKW